MTVSFDCGRSISGSNISIPSKRSATAVIISKFLCSAVHGNISESSLGERYSLTAAPETRLNDRIICVIQSRIFRAFKGLFLLFIFKILTNLVTFTFLMILLPVWIALSKQEVMIKNYIYVV